jgi:hypothetical protein
VWARHPDTPDAQRGPYRMRDLLNLVPTAWPSPTGLILARTTRGPWLGCDKYPGLYQKLAGVTRPIDHHGAWRDAARRYRERGDRRLALWAYRQLTQMPPPDSALWREYGDFCLELGLPKEARRVVSELRRLGAKDDADELLKAVQSHSTDRKSQARSSPGDAAGTIWELGLRQGTTLGGRYRLDQRLGRGGMGVVWRASDLVLGDTVAVKFLLDPDAVARRYFRREIAIAARVTHANVCRVYEAGEVDGRPFISMEFVEGLTLEEALRTPRSTSWRLAVLIRTAEALAAIHAEKIVHRDLKPGNVMVTPEAGVKVMDFGIARPVSMEESRATAPWIGTLAYMSPEQMAGGAVDHRSDVYSFGILAWETFTGHLPYPLGDGSAFEARMKGDLPDAGRDFLTPGLLDLVRQCLAPTPGQRPRSMSAILDQLRSEQGQDHDHQ